MTQPTTLIGDMPVRRIGFGALRLLGPHGWGAPPDGVLARRVLRRAAERCDLIDLADCYGPWIAEHLVAEHLRPFRDGLLITTKGGRPASNRSSGDRPARQRN